MWHAINEERDESGNIASYYSLLSGLYAYLKILVFPFCKAQFGCSPSHVQIPRCIKSLHASIKRKLTNACTLYMHACIAINTLENINF